MKELDKRNKYNEEFQSLPTFLFLIYNVSFSDLQAILNSNQFLRLKSIIQYYYVLFSFA